MGAPVAPERRRRVQGSGRDAITQMKRRTEKETEGTLGAALLSLQRQTRAGVVAASVSGMERGQAVWDRIVTPPPPTFHSPPCLKVPTLLASGLGEHPWYLRQAQGGVLADGGTGRGRQGWLVTPSDCRRRGVNGGKGRVLSLGQEARGCGQHKRGNLAQSENGTQETPLSPDILPRYTPPLRLVPLRPGPSAHARRGWPLRRQEPGKTRHMQYTTPSRKGGFGEDSSFPQDPCRSHLETTLKWRTPPPSFDFDCPKSQLYFCHP